MDEMKFSVRKSDFDKFAERLGVSPEELLSALKAEVVKVGPGFRYVINMENFFYFVLSKIFEKKRPAQREVSQEEFEDSLNKAIDRLAGISGYAKLVEVKEAVTQELGIGEEEFVKRLSELLQRKRGAYVLLEGGDAKIQIGAKKYGFIKRVEKRAVAEVVYY
ncbi:hypothetical protein [Pyrobaculum aerophilum]|uniref:Uncharacterized protein n=2 Tax=Pyrobaculum aerophilum TaxID=13773 RepID=Q8ZYA0_PYRAE|nr:conserved hypothetical protein [Pyrobaculum aerophilum str. IM2]HII48139.1 hypothetical protein [Pyrobaculum aerophilum]